MADGEGIIAYLWDAITGGCTRRSLSSANRNRVIITNKCGLNDNGSFRNAKLDQALTFKGGLYYIAGGPIRTRSIVGGPTIRGGGVMHFMVPENYFTLQNSNNSGSIVGTTPIFCRTDTDDPTEDVAANSCLILYSAGADLDGLCFYGRRNTTGFATIGERTRYGIVVDDNQIAGVYTAKHTFRNLSFHQFHKAAIYVNNSDQVYGDTLKFDGIMAISNYLDPAIEDEYTDTWSFLKVCSGQSITHDGSAILTIASDTNDFWAFDFGDSNQVSTGGGVQWTGSILFNRAGGVVIAGTQAYNGGRMEFRHAKWDNGLTNKATAAAVLMKAARPVLATIGCDISMSAPALYRRPLVWPMGGDYDIELIDKAKVFHQVDLDAWPVGGVFPSDPCMSRGPEVTPTARWVLGNPTTVGSVSEGAAVTDILDETVNNHDLTQGTASNRANYSYEALHNRPGLVFDGVNDYYSKASAAGLGPGAAYCEWEWCGQFANNGAIITLMSASGGNNNIAMILGVLADGTIYAQITSNGSVANLQTNNNLYKVPPNQTCHVRLRFVGGTGGTGILDLSVNGVLNRVTHSQATLFNATAPFYLGTQDFSGAVSRIFNGKMYHAMVTVGSDPGDAERIVRQDLMASQVGAPIDVALPMVVLSAPNTSLPTICTSGQYNAAEPTLESHGLGNKYWNGTAWVAPPTRWVRISGATGNTAINGIWPATIIDGETFSIPVTGNGTYAAESALLEIL